MNIKTTNAEEYIVVRLSLAGELDQEAVLESAPFANGSVYRAIKNLRDARVILKHRYDDGRVFLRLSSLSEEYLKSLSPALLANARSLIRDELKYSGSKAVRMRERANYEFYGACVDSGIAINGIKTMHTPKQPFEHSTVSQITGDALFSKDGSPTSFEDICSQIDGSYTGLLTKKIVKKRDNGEITHQSNRNSRCTGTLIISGQIYQVYALSDPETSAWVPEAEFNTSNYVAGCIQRESPYFRDKGILVDNKCILAYPTVQSAEKMILQPDGKALRIDPCHIYSASYIRPHYSLSDAMIKLLGIPDWRRYMASLLFPDGRRMGIADVVTKNTEVYNFIGADLNRIRQVTARILQSDENMSILVEPWMTDVIYKLFGRDRANVEIVELGDEDVSVLADSII